METANHRIAENARRIELEIRMIGHTSVAELERATQLHTDEILLALGWLAREERIDCNGTEIHPLSSEFYF